MVLVSYFWERRSPQIWLFFKHLLPFYFNTKGEISQNVHAALFLTMIVDGDQRLPGSKNEKSTKIIMRMALYAVFQVIRYFCERNRLKCTQLFSLIDICYNIAFWYVLYSSLWSLHIQCMGSRSMNILQNISFWSL